MFGASLLCGSIHKLPTCIHYAWWQCLTKFLHSIWYLRNCSLQPCFSFVQPWYNWNLAIGTVHVYCGQHFTARLCPAKKLPKNEPGVSTAPRSQGVDLSRDNAPVSTGCCKWAGWITYVNVWSLCDDCRSSSMRSACGLSTYDTMWWMMPVTQWCNILDCVNCNFILQQMHSAMLLHMVAEPLLKVAQKCMDIPSHFW